MRLSRVTSSMRFCCPDELRHVGPGRVSDCDRAVRFVPNAPTPPFPEGLEPSRRRSGLALLAWPAASRV